jgi:predicted ATPase
MAKVGAVHTLGVARRVTSPTFVGREDELARLDAAAQMATTAGQLVVIAGDAGVGKTRLIEEAASRWRARGGTAVVGGCVDLGGLGPGYAPFLEVLRRLRTEVDAALLDQLLRDSAPELLPLLTGGFEAHGVRQDAVLAHALALFEAIGEHLPGLVVVFEDLHWADPSTRDLVAFLARNLRAAKVALMLTYRIDDLHRQHPLRPSSNWCCRVCLAAS